MGTGDMIKEALKRAGMVVAATILLWLTPGMPVRAQDVAFEDVVARLRSQDSRARLDALKLLKAAGYIDAVMPVMPLIADPSPDVQVQAIDTEISLYLVDEAYTRELTRDLARGRDMSLAARALAQGRGATIGNLAPPAVIGALAAAVGAGDPRVRQDALDAIGVLGPPLVSRGQFPDPKNTIPRLTAALRDPMPPVRASAAVVLGRLFDAALGDPKAGANLLAVRGDVGEMLVNAMNDADQDARHASISATGYLRYERAIRSLLDFYAYYKRDLLGLASLDALARIGHASCLGTFAGAYDVKDDEVRRLAVEGVARVGDRPAVQAILARAESDTSSLVHLAAAFARAKGGDYSELTAIVDAVKKPELQALAFDYLVELGPAVVPSLGVIQNYRDPKVRAALAELLGIIGTPSLLPTVDALARDRDRLVSSAAQRSQARLTLRQPGQSRRP